MSSQIVVDVAISSDDFVALYRGTVKDVLTTATDGRSIRFPANILRPFLTHDGIYGRFVIRFNRDNKFDSIEKLS